MHDFFYLELVWFKLIWSCLVVWILSYFWVEGEVSWRQSKEWC